MSWTFKQSIQRVWKYPFIQKQLQLYNNVEFSLCYIKNPAPQLLSSASSRQAGCGGAADNKFMILIMATSTMSENENVLVFMALFCLQ